MPSGKWRASSALRGGSSRQRQHCQGVEVVPGVVSSHFDKSAVDDVHNAFDGDRSLGNIGSDDNLALVPPWPLKDTDLVIVRKARVHRQSDQPVDSRAVAPAVCTIRD